MPDFTIEYYAHCESYEQFETEVMGSKKYRVWYGPVQTREYGVQTDWQCECKGFQFRKTCKHIAAAKESYCGWSEKFDDGHPTDQDKCPKCGSDTRAMGWAC